MSRKASKFCNNHLFLWLFLEPSQLASHAQTTPSGASTAQSILVAPRVAGGIVNLAFVL
jgi:hypothetical protein